MISARQVTLDRVPNVGSRDTPPCGDLRDERYQAALSGPVKAYKMVEEWLPITGRRGFMIVSLRRSGLFIGRAVMKEALKVAPEDCRRCRFRFNHLTKELIIEVTPDGPWRFSFKQGSKTDNKGLSAAKAGGNTIPQKLKEQGIKEGSYPARVEGNRIIVDFKEALAQ